MSAAALAAVTALGNKAFDLGKKGHFARAIEKYAAAVESAQALGYSDCLITATLRGNEAMMSLGHGCAPGVPDTDPIGEWERAIQLLLPAISTLRRRKAAGTLLAGACHPWEEAWAASQLRHQKRTASVACFVGYEAYLEVAVIVLSLVQVIDQTSRRELILELAEFAVSAADLVLLPRRDGAFVLGGELRFVSSLSRIEDGEAFQQDATAYEMLQAAWRRLVRSGVVEARNLRLGIPSEQLAFHIEKMVADAEKQHAAATLRCCALGACGAREVHEAQFKSCAACKAIVYCCREHQAADWPAHKAACKAARKAAAQGGAGPSSGA